MANELDELNPVVNEQGRDVNVIEKQIPVTVGVGSKIFEIALWCAFVIPGIVFQYKKVKAEDYLSQLQQKIQHDASQIDNFLEQRVTILKNCASLLNKAIELDKETFVKIAQARSGNNFNEVQNRLEDIEKKINIAVESYPNLESHNQIAEAMKQNSYLQKEITAAREVYNDTINQWNHDIFEWPTKRIVAAKKGYTTRIPFVASKAIKEAAKEDFFK